MLSGRAAASAAACFFEAIRLVIVVMTRTPQMTPRETGIEITGTCTAGLVQGVQHQLDADEAEDDRQAVAEVDQLLQQAADEEVQLAQTHQGEGVGREDDVRVLGEAEDRGDRVQGEQHVGGADGEHDDHQRGQHALAVVLDEELGAVVLVGDAELLLDGLEEAVLLELLFLLVLAGLLDQLPRGVDEEGAEDEEDPGEAGDDRGSRRR